MNILLFGMPGSGKGTLLRYLSASLTSTPLSQGDILRSYLSSDESDAKRTKEYIEKIGYVPDELSIRLTMEALNGLNGGFILDGFPRSLVQKEQLDDYLHLRQIHIDYIFYLHVSEESAKKRILLRNRLDDQKNTAEHRIEKFRKFTFPTIEAYRSHPGFVSLDGEQSPSDIQKNVQNILFRTLS